MMRIFRDFVPEISDIFGISFPKYQIFSGFRSRNIAYFRDLKGVVLRTKGAGGVTVSLH